MTAITRRRVLTFDVGRRDAARWLRVHRTAMACRFEITLPEEDAARVGSARRALDEADRIEDLLTVFRPSSELSRVNREAGSGAVSVSAELGTLLQRCARLHAATDGAFDITSTPLSRCWGFLRREGRVPSTADIESARTAVGMAAVTFDAAARAIRFEKLGMELNLGAIGKGYALDRMAEVLRGLGVDRALISAGGSSVLALEASRLSSEGWPIDLTSPRVSRPRLARVHLRHAALGTSGAGEQFVASLGAHYGHVIDPRTGWPAQEVLSASVIANDAATADALSTAFLVAGSDLAARYCVQHPETIAVLTLAGPPEGGEEPVTRVFGKRGGVTLER